MTQTATKSKNTSDAQIIMIGELEITLIGRSCTYPKSEFLNCRGYRWTGADAYERNNSQKLMYCPKHGQEPPTEDIIRAEAYLMAHIEHVTRLQEGALAILAGLKPAVWAADLISRKNATIREFHTSTVETRVTPNYVEVSFYIPLDELTENFNKQNTDLT